MTDVSTALDNLRINRGAVQTARRPRWMTWPIMGIGAAMLATGAWRYYAEASVAPAAAPVVVSNASQEPAAVSSSVLDASGYVIARRQATLSAKITGRLTEVTINEGDRVEKDQVIATLDQTSARAALAAAVAQIGLAEANVEAAQVAMDGARAGFERNEVQRDRGLISAQAFETAKSIYDALRTNLLVNQRAQAVAEAARAVKQRELEDTVIKAPFAGVITVKAAQPGEIVSPGSAGGGFTRTGICTLVDMDSLELDIDVSESFIERLAVDQPATVTLNAYPNWQIPARVLAVVPTADRTKATVKVRLGFLENDARILPEMGARVSFLQAQATARSGST